MPDRRLSGEICVDDNEAEAVEVATEKRAEGGFEMGVSRSAENSNPGKFPRCKDRGGSDVVEDVAEGYMLLMYVQE